MEDVRDTLGLDAPRHSSSADDRDEAMTASTMSDIELILCSGKTLHFTAVQRLLHAPGAQESSSVQQSVRKAALLTLYLEDLDAAGAQLLLA